MGNYMDIPDHPVIRNMEHTGYPDGKEPEYPHCPVCGEQEIEKVYLQDAEPIGCDACIRETGIDGDTGMCPVCPACGEPFETAYTDARSGEILGCDMCVAVKDAWEYDGCFYGER